MPPKHQARTPSSDDWPEPLPLIARAKQKPYPLDAFPPITMAAGEEVHAYTQAPVALVAGCTLSAISLAAQAVVDERRDMGLSGPASLFVLTIADSGERKSTVDGYFTKAIHDYEREQEELARPAFGQYHADLSAWEAKRSGTLDEIKALTRKGEDTGSAESKLAQLEDSKPEHLRVPHLLLNDETPESLAAKLANVWPSAGIISSEAGIVFGSHGMVTDSLMRNLGMLNTLWDGGSLRVGRRSSESFTVRDARLTVALQVQEETLRAFIEKTGGLARGTGFLARFLLAWPESTQGTRFYRPPPDSWPSLERFNCRITEVLRQTGRPLDDGGVTTETLPMTRNAHMVWREFHDSIEKRLANGGDCHDVRDVAAKIAANMSRIAALFQIFEFGGTEVGVDAAHRAMAIAEWHLEEARRFFGTLALSPEMANAVCLDEWLLDYCKRHNVTEVHTRTVQQFGPKRLRDKDTLLATLTELQEMNRAKLISENRSKVIVLNPVLLQPRDV